MVGPLIFLGGMLSTLTILYIAFALWKRRTEAVLAAIERRLLKPGVNVIADATDCLARLKVSSKELDTLPSQLDGTNKRLEALAQGLATKIGEFNKSISTQIEELSEDFVAQILELTARLDATSFQSDRIARLSGDLDKRINELRPILEDLLTAQETLGDFYEEGVKVMANRISPRASVKELF